MVPRVSGSAAKGDQPATGYGDRGPAADIAVRDYNEGTAEYDGSVRTTGCRTFMDTLRKLTD